MFAHDDHDRNAVIRKEDDRFVLYDLKDGRTLATSKLANVLSREAFRNGAHSVRFDFDLSKGDEL